jgi:hypothetical protein
LSSFGGQTLVILVILILHMQNVFAIDVIRIQFLLEIRVLNIYPENLKITKVTKA